jgi:hypothetical protein
MLVRYRPGQGNVSDRLLEARASLVIDAFPGIPAERKRIGLDTNLFIYSLEDHPRYGRWCASLFELIERAVSLPSTG